MQIKIRDKPKKKDLAVFIVSFPIANVDNRLPRLTPELTGRAFNTETIQVNDEIQANSRSG
jgi:hypothetical protein